jgi:predicted DNA-binding transcriptional regulator AlpA
MTEDFFTVRDILARYGICRMTLKNWLKAGEFPMPMKVGNRHRWQVKRVLDFEDRRIALTAIRIRKHEESK